MAVEMEWRDPPWATSLELDGTALLTDPGNVEKCILWCVPWKVAEGAETGEKYCSLHLTRMEAGTAMSVPNSILPSSSRVQRYELDPCVALGLRLYQIKVTPEVRDWVKKNRGAFYYARAPEPSTEKIAPVYLDGLGGLKN